MESPEVKRLTLGFSRWGGRRTVIALPSYRFGACGNDKNLKKGVMNERSGYWNEENERLRSVDGLEIHLCDRALKAELVVLVHNLGSEAPQLVNPIEDDRRH